jgi:hypothetical protein
VIVWVIETVGDGYLAQTDMLGNITYEANTGLHRTRGVCEFESGSVVGNSRGCVSGERIAGDRHSSICYVIYQITVPWCISFASGTFQASIDTKSNQTDVYSHI